MAHFKVKKLGAPDEDAQTVTYVMASGGVHEFGKDHTAVVPEEAIDEWERAGLAVERLHEVRFDPKKGAIPFDRNTTSLEGATSQTALGREEWDQEHPDLASTLPIGRREAAARESAPAATNDAGKKPAANKK